MVAPPLVRRRPPKATRVEAERCVPAAPGQIERYDCEYRRNRTANLFVFLDVNRPWRRVKVTERRVAQDFAACMRDLTDAHYPGVECIRVVLDNLSTHSAASRSRSKFWQANASIDASTATRGSSSRSLPGETPQCRA